MNKKNYFQGWYFKCCSKENTIAFIPAYHRHNNHQTASLQIITDNCSFNVPFDSLCYEEKPLSANIGNCVFSEKGIELDIHRKNMSAVGTLEFSSLSPLEYDIMGPFRFVPYMQCRHSIYSMRHRVNGAITLNGRSYVFKNGKGYIEGDSGFSFPDRYVWTQCFFRNGGIMLSVADIPFMGFSFTGIIGVIMINGKEHRIATYLGARLKHVGNNHIVVKQGSLEVTACLINSNSHPLYAPDNGTMSRTIHENPSCTAYYQVSNKGKTLCEFMSRQASFEFEY